MRDKPTFAEARKILVKAAAAEPRAAEILAMTKTMKPVTAKSLAITEAMEAAEAEANYRMILECARDTLAFKHYTEEDRKAVETSVNGLKHAWDLRERLDDYNLSRAFDRGMIHAFVLGGRCTLCDSDIEYRRDERRIKGGKQPNPGTEAWHAWADPFIEARPNIHPRKMAKTLCAEESKPAGLPKEPQVAKYVAKVHERLRAAGKSNVYRR